MTIVYEEREQQARHFLTLLGGGVAVARFDELLERVNADREEALVVFGPSTSLSEAVGFAEQCRLQRPGLGVVLLRERVDVTVVTEALRAGLREVVDASDHAGVLAACARSRDLSRQIADPAARHNGRALGPPGPDHGRASVPALAADDDGPRDAKVITVFSAKGGCGKSTIATNLAVALADGGARRVCLVDLDLAFGDIAIMLQLDPKRTIADAVPVADRIDETGLRILLTPYAPGIDTLLAPVQPALAEDVNRNLITDLLHLARGMFDYIVVDTASQFTEQILAALDAAHEYVLVAVPELPALKNLRVTLDMFDLLDYRRESRVVVLNRADAKVGLSTSDAERV
ncbi:MAG TPA: P-loop NTPase, partial [Jiangellales bacterium]|nr:P-loop NTPase [Jiangellales bacterium]